MRVWIITVGEPVPLPGRNDRLLRSGVLASYLAERGHEVEWWTSRVDHIRKAFFPVAEMELQHGERLRIHFLRGRLYRKNVSLARLVNHREIAHDFTIRSSALPVPDFVLCSLPPLELSLAAVEFGRRSGCPVYLDIRDLWPDVYEQVFPPSVRWLGRILFRPFRHIASRAVAGAIGLFAVSETYLDWGLRLARRERRASDLVITFGYPTPPPVNETEIVDLRTQLDLRPDQFVAWFVGSFAGRCDLGTIIEAARQLAQRSDIVFVLSGAGDREAAWRSQAAGLPNVRFTGWVDRRSIACLLRIASVGLVCYTADASMSLTNKIFEYMSGGLPLIVGLRGEAEALVARLGCGVVYTPGDQDDLVRATLTVADDPALRARLARASAKGFREEFAEEVIFPRLVRAIEARANQSGADRAGRGV